MGEVCVLSEAVLWLVEADVLSTGTSGVVSFVS